ncbi:Crp/Fnr family transcriptional regulator [Pendulispora albinea]|uniref:Crp/Fnr family transcriptional regulator n=1 Tax=Pendulispora albinea TaxID=2741071 RepID=A0ABZ2LWS4_9BACT
MSKKEDFFTRIKVSSPVRALGRRAVEVLDARERRGDLRPSAWHRPAGAWALERARLLTILPEREMTTLIRDARIHRYGRRSIESFDDDDPHVWIVLEGGVKLCRTSALGQRWIEAILEPGDAFGRLSVHSEGVAYEVQALEPTRLAAIARDRFEALLRAHPELAYSVVQHLEARQRKLVRRIESLVFKDVHMRVAETILELAREPGDPCPHGFAVDLRITQQDIAELVGASRQMVNRVLGDFERRLYLQRLGRVVCVLHRERLERFAESAAQSAGDASEMSEVSTR